MNRKFLGMVRVGMQNMMGCFIEMKYNLKDKSFVKCIFKQNRLGGNRIGMTCNFNSQAQTSVASPQSLMIQVIHSS